MNGKAKVQELDDEDLDNVTGGAVIQSDEKKASMEKGICPECRARLIEEENNYGGTMFFYKCSKCRREYEYTRGFWIDFGVRNN